MMLSNRLRSPGILLMVAITGSLGLNRSAHAGPLFDWLFGLKPTYSASYGAYPYNNYVYAPASTGVATSMYAPGTTVTAGYGSSGGTAVAPALPPTSVLPPTNVVPPTSVLPPTAVPYAVPGYTTQANRVPVTYYRPVTEIDPATGQTVTRLQPCTSYTYQALRVPSSPWLSGTSNAASWNRWPSTMAPTYPVPSNTVNPVVALPTTPSLPTYQVQAVPATGLAVPTTAPGQPVVSNYWPQSATAPSTLVPATGTVPATAYYGGMGLPSTNVVVPSRVVPATAYGSTAYGSTAYGTALPPGSIPLGPAYPSAQTQGYLPSTPTVVASPAPVASWPAYSSPTLSSTTPAPIAGPSSVYPSVSSGAVGTGVLPSANSSGTYSNGVYSNGGVPNAVYPSNVVGSGTMVLPSNVLPPSSAISGSSVSPTAPVWPYTNEPAVRRDSIPSLSTPIAPTLPYNTVPAPMVPVPSTPGSSSPRLNDPESTTTPSLSPSRVFPSQSGLQAPIQLEAEPKFSVGQVSGRDDRDSIKVPLAAPPIPDTLNSRERGEPLKPMPAPPGIDATPRWNPGLLDTRDRTAKVNQATKIIKTSQRSN